MTEGTEEKISKLQIKCNIAKQLRSSLRQDYITKINRTMINLTGIEILIIFFIFL